MTGKRQMTIQKLIDWRKRHVSDRQFTLVLSFLVGFFAAVAAFVLHKMINLIEDLLTDGFTASSFNWLYLIFPVIGIFLTSLFVRYVVRDNISHGITRILYAISSNRSRLKKHNAGRVSSHRLSPSDLVVRWVLRRLSY